MRTVKINTLKGYEDFDGYTINEQGDIFSYYIKGTNRKYSGIDWLREPIKMRTVRKSNGYMHLGLCDVNGNPKYPTVHRLLALAFIDNPFNLTIVNHKNGNKLDNRLCNLEWVDHSGNSKHAYDIGANTNEHICKPVEQYTIDGILVKRHKSITDAIVSLGFKKSSKSAISRVCRGKQKTCGGFVWKTV